MKPCQALQKESTQERERKRNKGQGPKSKQAKQPKRGRPQGGKGTTKSIFNGAQYVTPDSIIYCEKSKCVGLGQEIGFSAPNSCSLSWLVNGATQLCPSRKECNQLDLTVAQYF
jgi:hypothetical protein